MKQLFTRGLAVAAILSVSLPLASMAQTVTTQSVTTTSSQSISAAPVASESIIISGNADAMTLPRLAIAPSSSVQLNLMNFSPEARTFSIPTLNVSYVVPANSERMVFLSPAETANLTAGQEVAYHIVDANGNQVAAGTLVNEGTIASSFTQTTTVAAGESAIGRELAEKYEVNEVEPEPVSAEPATTGTSTVRGFW